MAAGSDYTLVGLAWAYQANRDYAHASDTIEKAVAKGVKQSRARRATWHYQEELGLLSNKAIGRAEFKRLSEASDVFAARAALINHERRSRRINAMELLKVLDNMQTAMEQGDVLATISLARAYRQLSWLIPNAGGRLAERVEDHGHQLGVRYESAENVTVIHDPNNHRQALEDAYSYLQTVDGNSFAYGLSRLLSIERTSYVYVLQKELAKLGYFNGRPRGVLTSRTTEAMLAFCRDEGIYDTGIHGPLNYDSALEMSLALGERRGS